MELSCVWGGLKGRGGILRNRCGATESETITLEWRLCPPIPQSDNGKIVLKMESLTFVNAYINEEEDLATLPARVAEKLGAKGFSKAGLERQIDLKINLIASVENYLMAHWDEDFAASDADGQIKGLAQKTLAYSLAEDDKERDLIVELFNLLASNIREKISDGDRQAVFGRSLFGLRDSIAIESWVDGNIEVLLECEGEEDLFEAIWEILFVKISNKSFKKCDKPELLLSLSQRWISGQPYFELLEYLKSNGAKINAGKQKRELKLDHVIDMTEGGLSFDGTLTINAIIENISRIRPDESDGVVEKLSVIQKKLKYGLPSQSSINIFEMGFSDRVISQNMATVLGQRCTSRWEVREQLSSKKQKIIQMFDDYPKYYSDRLAEHVD